MKGEERAARVLKAFRSDLGEWYATHARSLPWRSTADPWRILISEYVLQQTRVEQGLPYYERLIRRFPRPQDLAGADRDDLMKQWEGLGYYARARRLHEAARVICDRHAGRIPADHDALLELPGVGPYTAAAVASIAFALPHPAVDGNARRVLSRVFGITESIEHGRVRSLLQERAQELIDPSHPGDWNQALMELGAVLCTPADPACTDCPLATVCDARARGLTDRIPHREKRAPLPHHDVAVGVLRDPAGRLLLRRRPDHGLLGGLWEFPQERVPAAEEPARTVRRLLRSITGERIRVGEALERIRHSFTHFRVTLHPFSAQTSGDADMPAPCAECAWVGADRITELALPRAHRKLAERLRA